MIWVECVCQVVRLYNVADIVMSSDVVCCGVVCSILVGVSVFSMCSELLIMSEIR